MPDPGKSGFPSGYGPFLYNSTNGTLFLVESKLGQTSQLCGAMRPLQGSFSKTRLEDGSGAKVSWGGISWELGMMLGNSR